MLRYKCSLTQVSCTLVRSAQLSLVAKQVVTRGWNDRWSQDIECPSRVIKLYHTSVIQSKIVPAPLYCSKQEQRRFDSASHCIRMGCLDVFDVAYIQSHYGKDFVSLLQPIFSCTEGMQAIGTTFQTGWSDEKIRQAIRTAGKCLSYLIL